MREFARWAWILFFIAGAIHFILYFSGGRTNASQFAIGVAFLILAGLNFARSRRRTTPDSTLPGG
ncbi:MAG TPA: hypothetical protein VFS56_06785 [Gemmatimonadaceae bacterium]|nr:hypothetical protein [Gemmatimonadaceae bacterium]